ncbi:hypothetical protein G6F32_014395 [Rhizopus arrhizus]|nr:hypothetical protein G6F32_014395 [Rhizopus arrhizus]
MHGGIRAVIGQEHQAELLRIGVVRLGDMRAHECACRGTDQVMRAAPRAALVILTGAIEFDAVAGQQFDAGGQQGHLDFRGAGVGGAALVVFNDLLGVDRHFLFSL